MATVLLLFLEEQKFTCWRHVSNYFNFAESCQNGSLPSWLVDNTYNSGFRIVRDGNLLNKIPLKDQSTMSRANDVNASPQIALVNATVPIRTLCRNYINKMTVPCPAMQTSLAIRFVDGSCTNVVAGVSWTVFYSYDGLETDGIQELRAEIFLRNLTLSDLSGFPQFFSVTFKHREELESTPFESSGHPGYMFGKPILAGKLENRISEEIESSQRVTKLSSRINLPNLPDEWLTALSAGSVSADCTAAERSNVLFGVNTIGTCLLPFETSCALTQQTINKVLLGGGLKHNFVGMFGNSNVSRPGEWVPLRSNFTDIPVSGEPLSGYCEKLVLFSYFFHQIFMPLSLFQFTNFSNIKNKLRFHWLYEVTPAANH